MALILRGMETSLALVGMEGASDPVCFRGDCMSGVGLFLIFVITTAIATALSTLVVLSIIRPGVCAQQKSKTKEPAAKATPAPKATAGPKTEQAPKREEKEPSAFAAADGKCTMYVSEHGKRVHISKNCGAGLHGAPTTAYKVCGHCCVFLNDMCRSNADITGTSTSTSSTTSTSSAMP